MYSDDQQFKWDNVRNYYQPKQNNQLTCSRKRQSNESQNGGENNDQQKVAETIATIVRRSGILAVEKGKQESCSGINSSTDRPCSSASLTVIEDQSLETDPATALLPTFDQLCGLPPAIQCHKFFQDLQPLDRILVRIVRTGMTVLHVELICMLTRFRRNLLAFMKGKLMPIAFDRTKRFYQVNDYVSTTVVSISPNSMELDLQLDEDEAIFTHDGIPAYCRDFGTTTFDDSPHIAHIRDNPNLALQLGIPINSQHSALTSLHDKHLKFAPSAEQMRRDQNARLAMTHVVRGAELTRENKCFEAIQCFNKALNVDDNCADAYVGRGAASAGLRNFVPALLDLEQAIQLQPEHRNARKYRLEVLMAYGRELEKSGELKEAREKFERLLELQPGHSQALEALKRLNSLMQPETEIIEIEAEEEGLNGYGRRRSESMTEEEVRRNREKLREMEEFIRKLKGGK